MPEFLSQRKNKIGLCYVILCYVMFSISVWDAWHVAEMSENRKLWNWSKTKHCNYISQAVTFLWFCQQAIERVTSIKCFVWWSFSPWTQMWACSKWFLRSTLGQRHRWRTIPSVNMNWLNLAFLPSIWKIELDFYLKLYIHLKLSSAIGNHVTTAQWPRMSNTNVYWFLVWNSAFENFITTQVLNLSL